VEYPGEPDGGVTSFVGAHMVRRLQQSLVVFGLVVPNNSCNKVSRYAEFMVTTCMAVNLPHAFAMGMLGCHHADSIAVLTVFVAATVCRAGCGDCQP
jgi:hypothetical protein